MFTGVSAGNVAPLSFGLIFFILGRHMMADDTTPHRTQYRMVFEMSDSRADGGALETACGIGERGGAC